MLGIDLLMPVLDGHVLCLSQGLLHLLGKLIEIHLDYTLLFMVHPRQRPTGRTQRNCWILL